jgi:3-oxoacyl-[acyl-carrier-protein] synthase-3
MPNDASPDVFVGSVACSFGELTLSVEEVAARGLLLSEARNFRASGFAYQRVCLPETNAYDLARAATAQIAGQLTEVDAIFYHAALPLNGYLPAPAYEVEREVRHLTDFPVSRLQADFGLERAFTLGVAQQACTGLFGAVRLARALLIAEPPLRCVLCVSADRVPEGALRESSYNPLADGATACLVSRSKNEYRLLAAHQISNGALSRATADDLVGNYFTYTTRLIDETLERAGLQLSDVAWIVPQNLAQAAWRVMCSLLRFDAERVLFPTLADVGHLVSGCNFVNLARAAQDGRFRTGDRILLPIAGYGLNWQCLLLERS